MDFDFLNEYPTKMGAENYMVVLELTSFFLFQVTVDCPSHF